MVARNRWKGRGLRDYGLGSGYINAIYLELNRTTGN